MDQIGDYRVERRLGAGAFATVWLGYDPRLDGRVAIKVLADNWTGDADVRRRFVEEARMLWRADDPRIVRVLTVGDLPTGQPYFVMEYADRGTLADRIETFVSQGGIPLDASVGLIAEVAACVGAVHDNNAIHRDVKPLNLLIRSGNPRRKPIPGLAEDERLIIADLGLAKNMVASSGLTIAAGSPAYMAPEQALPAAVLDQRVDVFALGVTAFQIITGTIPFDRGSLLGAGALTVDDIPRISLRRPHVPAAMDVVFVRALHPDREERYDSVDAFVSELRVAATAAVAPPTPASVPNDLPPAPPEPAVAASVPTPPPAEPQPDPATAPVPAAPEPLDSGRQRPPAAATQIAAPPTPLPDGQGSGFPVRAVVAVVLGLAVIAGIIFALTRGGADNADDAGDVTPTPTASVAPIDDNSEVGTAGGTAADSVPSPILTPPGFTVDRVETTSVGFTAIGQITGDPQAVMDYLVTRSGELGLGVTLQVCCDNGVLLSADDGLDGEQFLQVVRNSEGEDEIVWTDLG